MILDPFTVLAIKSGIIAHWQRNEGHLRQDLGRRKEHCQARSKIRGKRRVLSHRLALEVLLAVTGKR